MTQTDYGRRCWRPSIVSRTLVPCWPWRLRDKEAEHPIGGQCGTCRQLIAIPRAMQGYDGICLYCAIDAGLVPAEEVPPDDERNLQERWQAGREGIAK